MSNLVRITDPVCLDLPELEQSQGGTSWPFALEGREPRRSSFPTLPSLSMAALLHGLIFFLGLTLAVSTELPQAVVSITLVSGILDAETLPGPAEDLELPATVPSRSEAQREITPASPVTPPIEKARPVKAKPKPREPAKISKNDMPKIQEKSVSAPQVEAEQRGPAEDSGQNATSAGAVESGATDLAAVSGPSVSAPFAGAQERGHGGGGGGLADARFGDADGPRFIQRVMPKYPELARRRGREGLVLLRLVIGPGGELKDAEVVEGGGHGFDAAALAAVRASVYAPAMRGGQSMECAALLPIRFTLKGS